MNTHLYATAKGPRGPIKPLLDWRTLNEKMPWSLYLLLGGGFAIAQAAEVLIIMSCQQKGHRSYNGHVTFFTKLIDLLMIKKERHSYCFDLIIIFFSFTELSNCTYRIVLLS